MANSSLGSGPAPRANTVCPDANRRVSHKNSKFPAAFEKRPAVGCGACLEIPEGDVFEGKAGWRGATKENIPRGSSTEEQRSQTAFPSKTLRAAGRVPVAGVGSVVTARCGDAIARVETPSPPWPQPKSLVAAPRAIFRQALGRYSFMGSAESIQKCRWKQAVRQRDQPCAAKFFPASSGNGREYVKPPPFIPLPFQHRIERMRAIADLRPFSQRAKPDATEPSRTFARFDSPSFIIHPRVFHPALPISPSAAPRYPRGSE